MSWLAYEILTLQPDFSTEPKMGIDGGRDMVASPGGRSLAAWVGRTDRVMAFEFQTMSAEEWRSVREFVDRHGGRARAFFMPSWQHDFELVADVAVGDTQILLAGEWYDANVTEKRPDTVGRVLFIVNHLGQTAAHWVESFTATGGNDRVMLERPLSIACEAGRTVVAVCYLARLTSDTIESNHLSPSHASFGLGFRAIQQTRRVDQEELATGPEVGAMNAMATIVATDDDPIYDDTRKTKALGPVSYGGSQANNFDSEWLARVEDNEIVLTPPFGSEFASDLYNGTTEPKQIALAFDAGSLEVVAWDLGDGTSRVAFRDGEGDPQHVTFTGFSVCAFNTFAIDSTVTAGEATTAVFYLKRDDSSIYCRLISESFATERRYLVSPLAPLRLHRALREGATLTLIGMDAGHRLTKWQSSAYLTPPPQQGAFLQIEDASGIYREVSVAAEAADGAVLGLGADVGGEFKSIIVEIPGQIDGAGLSLAAEVGGELLELRRLADNGPEDALLRIADTASGEYKLVKKSTTQTDGAVLSLPAEATGSYTPDE